MSVKTISIRGARTHNLKNVSLDIPQQQLTMITGPSGSGKSSLAFNTLYAEGQRRFVESMSTYVRQFLERMERPDVDEIEGVLPAIAIEQKNSVKNARSTVATATELADYIRLFMTYCGETICPTCGIVVRKESPESISRQIVERFADQRIVVLAPLSFTDETRDAVVGQLLKGGFYRAWIDSRIADIKELELDGVTSLEMVVGRYRVGSDNAQQITDAVEQAFSISRGIVYVAEEVAGHSDVRQVAGHSDVWQVAGHSDVWQVAGHSDVRREGGDTGHPHVRPLAGWTTHRFTSRFSCDRCGTEYTEPTPHLFSFNSPLGACSDCQGYGRVIGVDIDKVIPDRSMSLEERPVTPWNSPGYEDCYDDLEAAAKKYKLRLDTPVEKLTKAEWDILYNGKGKWYGIKGFFDWLETKKYKIHVRVKLAKYRAYTTCEACGGSRLKSTALNVRFRDLTVADVFAMNVRAARRFWEYLALSKQEEQLAGHLRREITNRLVYLDEVGLGYLTLDRQTRTLSGGESQRINLAAALGSSLTETLYVIDEPTVGLHARDSERLLGILRRLRNAGNTVVVVEHDPTMIAGADHVVQLGPGAGDFGGQVIAEGKPSEIAVPETRAPRGTWKRAKNQEAIEVRGAREHNLKGVDVSIPLGGLVAITGVSGSGKSTLVRNCLYNVYERTVRGVANVDVGNVDGVEGFDLVEDIEFVDQSPIGRSTRSNPATYVKAWDDIRKLLADTTSAKLNGVTAGMFSFNTAGGRCDTCEGAGVVVIDMQFLADIEVVCDKCGGKRFSDQVLKVTYKQKNVDAILGMTVDEAIRFFVDKRSVVKKLDALRSVGLGYLRLGQSTASLSGGEAQRLKLASFLVGAEKTSTRRLFLFDEPTTGLHATDIEQLLKTFRQLIEHGNSVAVIEHNLQLIEASDWVIDLGPEGGDGGGQVVAVGTPRQIAANSASTTGKYLFAESTTAVA